MARSDVHAWLSAFDREQGSRKDGRAGLAWLGLVGDDDDGGSARAYFDRSAEFVGMGSSDGEGSSLAKPVDTATRLALLVWAGTIASLAVLFG